MLLIFFHLFESWIHLHSLMDSHRCWSKLVKPARSSQSLSCLFNTPNLILAFTHATAPLHWPRWMWFDWNSTTVTMFRPSRLKSLNVCLFNKRFHLVHCSLGCSCSLSALAIHFLLIWFLFCSQWLIVIYLTEGVRRVWIVLIKVLCWTQVLCGLSQFHFWCCGAHTLNRGECTC